MTASDVRVAVVTGASSGIGAAIARALGALGWRVVLGARRADRLAEAARAVEEAGGEALAFPCDVSEPGAIDALVGAGEARFGRVDVAVANAAATAPGLLHELDRETVAAELRTNLLHPLVLAQRVLPPMLAAGRGDLVFVSSENAVRPRPFQVGYTAAKCGVEGAAAALRMELEGTGVRVTVVRPGPTSSEFGRSWKPEAVRRVLVAWKHWGVQRHLSFLPPESTAQAVVAAVTAPCGTQLGIVELGPEGPSEVRIPG